MKLVKAKVRADEDVKAISSLSNYVVGNKRMSYCLTVHYKHDYESYYYDDEKLYQSERQLLESLVVKHV